MFFTNPADLYTVRVLTVFLLLTGHVFAASVSCGGSILCDAASFENKANEHIAQLLRDVVYATNLPESTTFSAGEHITCVDSTISVRLGWGPISFPLEFGDGGICMFPEKTTKPLTLASIRKLADDVVGKCKTCGAAPVQLLDSSAASGAILKFDYVAKPTCTGNCISPDYPQHGGLGSAPPSTVVIVQTVTPTITTKQQQQQTSTLATSTSSTKTSQQTVTVTQPAVAQGAASAATGMATATVTATVRSAASPIAPGDGTIAALLFSGLGCVFLSL